MQSFSFAEVSLGIASCFAPSKRTKKIFNSNDFNTPEYEGIPVESLEVADSKFGRVLPSIAIPRDRDWSELECNNLPHYNFECPSEYLIDMDETLEEGLQIVQKHIDNVHQVPPLVIARLYRGGKTTVLKALFQRLKDSEFFPIIISLNGGFKLRYPGEPPLRALIRFIATQLIQVSATESINDFVCEINELISRLDYLEQSHNKRIVLIIDDLNMLGVPIDDAVSNFLKVNFLDKKGRYLIFSSPVAMYFTDEVLISREQSIHAQTNTRSICTIHLPFSTDKLKLRQMGDECSGLCDLQITLGVGIPSLIYVIKNRYSEVSMANRFNIVMKRMINDKVQYLAVNRQSLIRKFLLELLDGENRETLFAYFTQIYVNKGKELIRYPLPYIVCIWEWLIDSQEPSLIDYAEKVELRKSWEVIIVMAMVLGFMRCKYNPVDINGLPNHGPLNLATEGVDYIRIKDIPGELRSIADVLGFFHSYLQSYPMLPKTIIIAIPRYYHFPCIAGLILYQGTCTPLKRYAYATSTPTQGLNNPEEIDMYFLLRGNASKRPYRSGKWYYVEESVIREMLGFSLQPLYPKDWGNVEDAVRNDFD